MASAPNVESRAFRKPLSSGQLIQDRDRFVRGYVAQQKLEAELARERYSWLTCNRITVKE